MILHGRSKTAEVTFIHTAPPPSLNAVAAIPAEPRIVCVSVPRKLIMIMIMIMISLMIMIIWSVMVF